MQALRLPVEIIVYGRGSRIEDVKHHPLADLDLIVLSPKTYTKSDLSSLYEWMQDCPFPVDIRKMTPQQASADEHMRLLIHSRSVHLFGERPEFLPVAANIHTMRTIFHQYAYYQFPPILNGAAGLRLLQLKLLTRSFGCIGFLQGYPFTRDIATCIGIAKDNDDKTGNLLEEYWRRLCEDKSLSDFNIQLVIKLLLRREREVGLLNRAEL